VIERIPLFPLELVLFPNAPLPLHIFEDRYKEMIGECLAHNREFGIVCSFPGNGGSMARVGCTGRIASIVNRYEDGRLDILTLGVRRFRIRHTVTQKSYREADVEWLSEDVNLDAAAAERRRVIDLHNQLILLAFEEGSAVDTRAPENSDHLAFALAHMLPFDLGVKQAILESSSEKRRLELLASAYEALLRRAEEIVHSVESTPKQVM
jgi:Lon protease-like protein